MPRPALTPADRARNVAAAADALAPALIAATAAMSDPDASPAERIALWEIVEAHGATIHRQSRLLAGKSKGG